MKSCDRELGIRAKIWGPSVPSELAWFEDSLGP
jgi:hypothetical protein